MSIKKNLLDLKYSKYLQFYNTGIIILFTYLIGLTIALLTKQIDYTNINHIFKVSLISIIPLFLIVYFLLNCKKQLNEIPRQIAKLE